jgi:hypothetical protein
MIDLFKIFQRLRKNNSSATDTILVDSIPNRLEHKIGISKEGLPMFFIATNYSEKTAMDINLKLIQVGYQKNCELINESGDISEGVYTIVSLKTNSEDMIKYFVNTVYYLISQLDPNPSFTEIKTELNNLVNLFRSLTKPPKKTIQGLWTELLFIEQGKNLEYLINSWHQAKNDRYDFNDGIDKIEIKSTSKNERIHRFSLNQLEEVKNVHVIIGSTYTIETGIGLCANDLIESINGKVEDASTMLKIYDIISETMGVDFERIYDVYFDYNFALNSIQYFDVQDIPKIGREVISPLITNIKYDCNLSHVVPLKTEEISSQLLKALSS